MSDTAPTVNPLLAKVRIPGETFRLPSLGIFYNNGELDESVVNGEVHVFPMTTLDEIVFKTPDKLFTGDAVIEVFSRCIPQIRKPKDLLAKDVDYLMTCLRMVSYGPTMVISHMHTCPNAKENSYEIAIRPFLQGAKSIDPTTIGSAFTHTLPNGQQVSLHPPLFSSVVKMSQTMDFNSEELTPERLSNIITEAIGDMIESVDGITDRGMIDEWLKQISAGWVKEISETVSQVSDWGVNLKANLVCRDCGEEVSVDISTNPLTFFI